MVRLRYTVPAAALLALAALSAGAAAPAPASAPLSAAAEVGRQMFFDRNLSGSGQLACASCHAPDYAHAAPNRLAVQLGGKKVNVPGVRAVPSLRYQEYTPPYADLLDNPDGISTPGPGGGYTQDGRAATLAAQARIPLLARHEMANASPQAVVKKLRAAPYADQFRQAFGAAVFGDSRKAFQRALEALQAYQFEERSFHPYDSKYDLYASNKIGGTLTPAEMRGFAVYSDPNKGNCFACHYNGAGLNGSVRLFTDFTYAAIGVPRNADIPANRAAGYADLGICERADHPRASNAQYCGMFKTPTLRNVATRSVFFHNGQLKSLADVISFYNTRDTEPQRWYPTVRGVVQKYNDLPPRYRANLDRQMPLDGRKPGSAAPMSQQDMQDLEAFLRTLTDRDLLPAQAAVQTVAPAGAEITDSMALAGALGSHLARQGDLCVGKFEWPIDVAPGDAEAGSRDAVQLPVLQKLGLVSVQAGMVARTDAQGVERQVPVQRYALTPAGQKHYVQREIATVTPAGETIVRQGDFCVAKLSLDKLLKWESPIVTVAAGGAAQRETTATFTYTVAAPDWAKSAELRKVFPMVAHVMDGEGRLQMKQRMRYGAAGWEAVAPSRQ
ncbi:MAG: cytochrome c peroxidase [Pseudomonadota bacterium]